MTLRSPAVTKGSGTGPWRHLRLPGGLPLALGRRGGPEILAARLAIPGGSGLDPVGQRGAHQLLAGLMTRGCGDLDAEALADRVEGAGAALRAEAHEDALVLGLKCAAADAPDLLPLLLAMVRRPVLATDQLEIERSLNLQTLQRQREDPFQLAHDQLRRQLYGNGPYGHDPLGCEEDLAGIARADLQPLVAALGARGAVLVLCGDLPEGVSERLAETLVALPWSTRAPQPQPFPPPQGPAAGSGGMAVLPQDTEQVVILLGAATVPLGHPDSLPLRLLHAHLGLGMSSRLFVTMREEHGLAYDVGIHYPARCGASPFVLHLSTSAERVGEAVACALEEWRRTLELPLAEEELGLARAKFLGQDAMGRQTGSQIADRQALILSHGLPPDHVERELERAAGVTPEEIRSAARRWLRDPCLSLVGPEAALASGARAWEREGTALRGRPERA
ncbi:MAG: pitrilysin family protein [Synechococcaceae cyanobacterium]|nr:pitrilysin family protein [Synechococcaceae cyanobacterium]